MLVKQIPGHHSPLVLGLGEATAGVLHPVLGSTIQKGCEEARESAEKSHMHDQRSGKQTLQRQAMGLFSLEKCRLRSDLMATYKFIRGDYQDLGEHLFT